jgi:NAD(P)H-hydrate epimerase
MRAIDRRAVEEYGIPALELMENAGRGVAEAADSLLRESGGNSAAVCCGRGNNGGDGLVAARRLRSLGREAVVFLCPPGSRGYSKETSANLARAASAGVPVRALEEGRVDALGLGSFDLLIDALLGTGSGGRPSGLIAEMIRVMNASGRPILAVDVPSGLNPDTGCCEGDAVRAVRTAALGLAKTGLTVPQASPFVGEISVLDIGFPEDLLDQAGA